MKDLGDIDYAVFPIELGALSYRTCFISPRYQQSLNKVKTLTELREKRHATGIERSFTALPPAPILFVHKSNQTLKNRLEQGLKLAFADGSLKKLWDQHFLDSIKFSAIKPRTLYSIKNKRIRKINRDYEQYLLPITDYY
ncbi:MAG: hypothetical protein IPK77_14930 [Cellvibrio sp.]|nr:hypothetical protein [Cellvibrio sp.]